MKKLFFIGTFLATLLLASPEAMAQCAMCSKTAQQLGEKPAEGLNSAILYLMLTPFFIMGYVGYRWWKNQKLVDEENKKN